MTPDTVHLAAQMIRHSRAMATSLEHWVKRQPNSVATRELLDVLVLYRGVLEEVEDRISKTETTVV